MAQQPTSMFGHMMAATKQTFRIVGAPVAFIGRASMQALERLIPQGAAEVAQAIHNGSAFVPYGPTERAMPKEEQPLGDPATDRQLKEFEYQQRVDHMQAIQAAAARGAGHSHDNTLVR